MEVGTEISQKIRSAIKAKLLELGAYVDDELPDYIMVMVANKKSRAQMSGDLCLFLGKNTDAFTEWLHGLLGKLQTIRVDSDKAADKQGKGTKSNKGMKEKKKVATDKSPKGDSSKSKDKDKKKARKHSSDTAVKRTVTSLDSKEGDDEGQSHVVDTVGKSQVVEPASQVEGEPVQSIEEISSEELTKGKQSRSRGSHEDIEDVRQLLVTEAPGDELAEELETTEAEVIKSKTGKDSAKTVSAQQKIDSNSSATSASADADQRNVQSSRKRKAPTSVVTSVNRQDEEEYDPYNPAVGSVASVVKVTSRKSSVPPSLQANRDVEDEEMEETLAVESQAHSEGSPPKIIRLSDTASIEHIKQAMSEVLERATAREDSISHFCRMVETTLRKLQPQDLLLAKLHIQKVLFDFEMSASRGGLDSTGENSGGQKSCSKCSNASGDVNSVETSSGGVDHCNKSANQPMTVPPDGILSNKSDLVDSSHPALSSPEEPCLISRSHSTVLAENKVDKVVYKPSAEEEDVGAFKRDNVESESIGGSAVQKSPSGRIIFRPKSKTESQITKSPKSHMNEINQSKISDSLANVSDRTSRLAEKSHLETQTTQSPVSSSKVDSGSPSSVHSCPPSSTSGLDIRRCIVSTSSKSRESTLSPVDSVSRSLAQTSRAKPSTSKSKPLPSILVDSIHNKKRSETESASVLKQSSIKDKSPRAAAPSDIDETVDSPRQYSNEALKVMAKNLKVTVINKRAINSQQGTSSDDSTTDDSEDDTSDDDEEDEDNKDVEGEQSNATEEMEQEQRINESLS